MNSDLYTNSLRLDDLVSAKLKAFIRPSEKSLCELHYEISHLKSLLYTVNQDRIVTNIQALRHELLRVTSRTQSISDKEFLIGIEYQEQEELTNHLALYEATGNSEICTVVNTSILPYSYETTEREFSPFSTSPALSPRLPQADSVPTVFLTTEATANKRKCKAEKPKVVLLSEESEESEESEKSEKSEESFSSGGKYSTLNKSNYLSQHRGDDDECNPYLSSACHSREGSVII
jgi:hypothetical protein